MSLILQSSGGGQITIQEPATASNFTQTLPAATGTVMVSGNQPAFSAYTITNQSIPASTFTKILLPLENFDTNNNFASSTFTPTVAGYYQINAGVSSSTTGVMLLSIFKNGAESIRGNQLLGDPGSRIAVVSSVIFLNGSTDFVELYFFQNAATSQNTSGSQSTVYMNGVMVRGA